MIFRQPFIVRAVLLLQIFVFSACTSPRIEHTIRDKPIGESYEPANVFAEPTLPESLYRVAVFPLIDEDGELAAEEIQNAMLSSLRSQARFEIVMVDPVELERATTVGLERISETRELSTEVTGVANRYDVDGILQWELTHYRPYKPLQIGVRGRLVRFDGSGDVLWSVDEIFDAGDKTVAIAARKYAEDYVDQPFPLQSSFSVLMSPTRFAAYVGAAIFETLPER